MSTHRSRRIDRRTAEHLLRGAPQREQAAGSDPLSDLLAAAAAPAREGELAGEQAALTAFRTAHLADAPQPQRESMLKTTLAKLVTVKIAIAAAAVVAAGGVAVAAVTGTLPTQGGDTATTSVTSTVASTTGQQTGGRQSEVPGKPAGTGKNAPQNAPDVTTDGTGRGDPASPAPSVEGLCHAYTAGAGSGHGKALGNPAFGALITAAGGQEKVPAFCADLLGAKKPGQPASPPGKPSAHPTGSNEDHPTGKPKGTPPPAHPGH
jgi:hypothetical protein